MTCYTVKTTHPCDDWNGTFTFEVHGSDQAGYFASCRKFGTGLTFTAPHDAIRDLVKCNGAQVVSITTDQIKQVGTIRVTNVDTGKTTYSAAYNANEVIDALRKGESVDSILSRLEAKAEFRMTPISTPDSSRNSFPLGM
jgi:hypothetical protein